MMPAQDVYGPAQGTINNGISHLFDYGIGMTCLALFLIASIALNGFLIRFFTKTVKELLVLIGEIKETLNEHN